MGAQLLPHHQSVPHQSLLLDHVEHREGGLRSHRIAAVSTKPGGLPGELGSDVGAGDDCRHRMAVAHRLAKGDDVRGEPMELEAPEVCAGPAEADLDLVGHEEPARCAPDPADLLQIRWRWSENPVAGEAGVDEHRSRSVAPLGQGRHRPVDAGGIAGRPRRVFVPVAPAVAVW